MKVIRRVFGLSMAGAMLGAVLAFAAPPQAALATGECACDDDFTGSYKCNQAQDACVAGKESCAVYCAET